MKIITPLQSALLSHLANFRFLTAYQFLSLGSAAHVQTIRKALRELQTQNQPLIKKLPFGVLPGKGKLSDVLYLTKYGAKAVAEEQRIDISEVYYPKNQTQYGSDYFHRLSTIDFHILMYKFSQTHQVEIDFFLPYYHFVGANHTNDNSKKNRQTLNKISISEKKYFIPDAILSLIDPNFKQWIFTVEVHKGHDTKRAIATLLKHAQAIEVGSVNNQYQYKGPIPVLMICETKEAMQAIQKRLASLPQFKNLEKYILLKYEEEVRIDPDASIPAIAKAFAMHWQTFTAKEVTLFTTK